MCKASEIIRSERNRTEARKQMLSTRMRQSRGLCSRHATEIGRERSRMP